MRSLGCRSLVRLLVGIVASFCIVTIASAQNTADVVGTVTDSSGGILPNATVTLTNIGTNISKTTQSSGNGDFTFTLLQVGTYSVTVEAMGFKKFEAPNLALSAGDRVRVDAKMEVGQVTQTVEVEATPPALETDTSSVGALVTSQGVEDLPLNNRNVIKLVQLGSGVNEGIPNSKGAGNGSSDDRRQTSAFSVNGQADFENNNLIDGMDNNERVIGTIGVKPSIDAIQQVKISTNLYTADVGRTAGGVVDVITKSGTNDLHGTAFEFFRNKVLNTNPNYSFGGIAVPNSVFQQNQFGGSVGGPIKKNKTFFFFDYEGFHEAVGVAPTFYTVPTYCERGIIVCPDGKTQFGDFSDINIITPPGGNSTGTQGGPGPDIPSASITPLGRAYLNMFPLPTCGPGTAKACGSSSGANGAFSNYSSAPELIVNTKTYDARVDDQLSGKDSLFVRYTFNHNPTIDSDGFPAVHIDPVTGNLASSGAAGAVFVHPGAKSSAGELGPDYQGQQSLLIGYTHLLSPSLIVSLNAGYLRTTVQSESINQGSNVSTALGFPCNSVSCVDYNLKASGLASVAVSQTNFSLNPVSMGDGGNVPQQEYDNSFQYAGRVTWTKGAQTIKIGAGLIRRQVLFLQDTAATGSFSFTGVYTGVGYGDLLEGLAVSESRNDQLVPDHVRSWEPSAYFQDDWRARSWLTLNLGIRYDIFTPYTETDGHISNYDPYIGLLVSPSIAGPQQSDRTAMVPTPYTDLAPRFGFAATLKHNTVIRGGFGLSFFPDNYLSQYFMRNLPFNLAISCQVQNAGGTNSACASPFENSATTNFGSTNGSGSQVGKTGGASLAGGLPLPVLNINNAINTAAYAGTSISAIMLNRKEAYVEQFNLLVEKQLGANVLTVGYVGELGRHTNYPGSTGTQSVPQNQPANPTEAPPLTIGGNTLAFGSLPGFPWLKSTSLNEEPNQGTSAYNALQASFVRRFSRGLTVNLNYTWAHMMDNTEGGTPCVMSEFAAPEPCIVDTSGGAGGSTKNVYGWQKYNWGNSILDVPNRLAWAVDYQLPFGKTEAGLVGGLTKGWTVNVSGSYQSGLPFTVTESSSVASISGAGSVRLDQIGSGKSANPTLQNWFNLSSFVRQTSGTLGNQDANQVFGPRQRHLDFSFFKDFPISEYLRMQFRTEIFNVFNTPNFGSPTSSVTSYVGTNPAVATQSGSVDTISTLNANENAREIQFALKLIF